MKPFVIMKGQAKVVEGVIFDNKQCVVQDLRIPRVNGGGVVVYDTYEQMSELFLEPVYGKSYRMMLLNVEGTK